MCKSLATMIVPLLCAAFTASAQSTRPVAALDLHAAPATQPDLKPVASNHVTAVTVYQGTALVTRDVEVKEGNGLMELIVRPLPPETIDSSLYTESTDGIRVLSTRFRSRAVKEDTRAAVREKEEQLKALQGDIAQLQKDVEVLTQNLQFLAKLEGFTGATMQTLTEKGVLNADSTVKLATFVMESRAEKSKALVHLQGQIEADNAAMAFAQRQLAELAAGSSRSEREAVIVVDKAAAAPGSVKLNYLVSAATWRPQYKLRAGGEKEAVQVEYLAEIAQQSGEDWTGVDLVLSTAQPMLNAAPPELLALDVAVTKAGGGQGGGNALSKLESYKQGRDLRQRAQAELNRNAEGQAGAYINDAAASEQWADLLAREDPGSGPMASRDGPSASFHLTSKLTVPSRNDQQLVEVARISLDPAYFYKAVPVLSPHVYRLATLTNKSKYILLPGEATMYLGADFVGRMNLPLVAIGEEFTVGFGVDPQIQVDRQLVDKSRSIQGGNQVQTYDYRIRVSSLKGDEVQLQVWDRLPRAEPESVDVELIKALPALSVDPTYLRDERPKNLLRWDLVVKPGTTGERAATIAYEFKMQYDRNVAIENFKVKK